MSGFRYPFIECSRFLDPPTEIAKESLEKPVFLELELFNKVFHSGFEAKSQKAA
jgi:hypothetical protein